MSHYCVISGEVIQQSKGILHLANVFLTQPNSLRSMPDSLKVLSKCQNWVMPHRGNSAFIKIYLYINQGVSVAVKFA